MGFFSLFKNRNTFLFPFPKKKKINSTFLELIPQHYTKSVLKCIKTAFTFIILFENNWFPLS